MTPLVCLHGFTGSPASWDDVAERVGPALGLRPTLLGHGTDAGATSDVRTFSDELARLAELLPPVPVHLAGYSLGARLALGLAVRYPERVARLTLVSVQPGLSSEAERTARREADARWCHLLETDGIEAFVNAWSAQPLFATEAGLPAASRARRRQERLAHDPRGLARSLRVTGLAEMPDYARAFAALRLPVSLLTGELDSKFLALGRAMAEALPSARLVVAPGAGHDLLLEKPALVARELLSAADRL